MNAVYVNGKGKDVEDFFAKLKLMMIVGDTDTSRVTSLNQGLLSTLTRILYTTTTIICFRLFLRPFPFLVILAQASACSHFRERKVTVE